ncbi:MAG: T9SS type A sorting domain-containing protein [Bacteroidales bacterium]|nr:T9SS type A sorting domain-containing protein [Bacteroidales bacterium]
MICLPWLANAQNTLEVQYLFSNTAYPNNIVPDSSGNGNDAEIVNFATQTEGYQSYVSENLTYGENTFPIRAIQMDSIIVQAQTYVAPGGTDPITAMAWVKIDTAILEGDAIITTFGASKSNRFEFSIKPDGTLSFNSKEQFVLSEAKINNQVWNHISITYDGTSMKFFIDGTEVLSNEIALTTATETTVIVGGFGSGKKFFTGLMYDFRLYSGALGGEEITAIIEEAVNSNAVGLDQSKLQQEIAVYPNPVTEMISITGISGPVNYAIMDITGKNIIRGESASDGRINVQSLKSGLYFLKLNSQNINIKFLKR